MTKFIIGIDSGGTKYLIKACDLNGVVISEHAGDPASHYRFPREEVIRRINENIDRCLEKFNGKREDCAYLVCGTTGIDSVGDQETVNKIYASLGGFQCPIVCINDAEVAHFAVTGGIGVVVIAGTGSVAFGRNSKGETARSGGWPVCIFGDEGSGTWISYQALHHLACWFDRRASSSILIDRLIKSLNIEKREDLLKICSKIEQMAWKNPGLASIVDQAADQGDPDAISVLRDAAEQTFALADSVAQKLNLHEEPFFKVGAWGSAIVKSKLHFQYFKEKFEAKYNNVQVLIADIDAAMGACRMALNLTLNRGRPTRIPD